MAQTVICPSCGATSTNLQRCEYCGAVIPPQQITKSTNENVGGMPKGMVAALDKFRKLIDAEQNVELSVMHAPTQVGFRVSCLGEELKDLEIPYEEWDLVCEYLYTEDTSEGMLPIAENTFNQIVPYSKKNDAHEFLLSTQWENMVSAISQFIQTTCGGSLVQCNYVVALDDENFVAYDSFGNIYNAAGTVDNPQVIKAKRAQEMQYQAAAPENKTNIWTIITWISIAFSVICYIIYLFI
ncbi:MAG: hypothetical protein IKO26_08995 [Paludibacteraceae bacterium]|nr:hypothetical protein [Paludibacteraceae bacterium]